MVSQIGASKRRAGVVNYRYLAIYSHEDTNQEVRVRSYDRPPKRRTFRIAGAGRKKFTRTKLYRIINKTQGEQANMARKQSQTKKKQNTKDVEDDDEDELEGLEELEDLDDEDVEEPEAEEDEEDEEPAPKRRRRTPAKADSKRQAKSKGKKAKVEDEEEEDEDEEEEAPKKRRTSKPAASKKSGAKKGTSAAGKTTAEATGGVGTSELAEAASEIAEVEITGRDVRVYLRREGIPKDEEHGRYVWKSKKDKAFLKLAKKIAAEYGEE